MGIFASERFDGARGEFAQLSILTRHFFGRLFRNDIIDFEDEMKNRLAAVLAVLGVLVGWISALILFGRYVMGPDANFSWQEKAYVFIFMMIIFGIVTLLEWEMLFPDRQDFLNLRPLPIKLGTFFGAKLASFVIFVGLFSTAMSSLSSLAFALFLAPWRSSNPLFLLRHVGAHLVSAFAACFFVFFACVFVQFLLMAVLPVGLYNRVSLLFRFLLITIFVFALLAFVVKPGMLDNSLRSMARLKDGGAPFIYRFPPLWFAGLYEVLLGNRDPVFAVQARAAVLAVVFSLAAFLLASGLSYHRHVRMTLEARKSRPRFFRLRERAGELVQAAVFWTPEERAVAAFFSKTLRASPKHRLTLTNYMAVAAGFMLLIMAAYRRGFRVLTPENINLLVQPLLLGAVLLIALWTIANIPAAPGARWIFQVTETDRRNRPVAGLKKAILFKLFLPLAGLVFVASLLLWRDWRAAFNHALFGLVISGLGIEAFFYQYRKIPFACASLPGRLLKTRGLSFILALIAAVSVLPVMERELLKNPSGFGVFLGFTAVLWIWLKIGSLRYLKTHPLIYDEEPDSVFVPFLDEE
jgi:hypothetical protein